MSKNDKNWKNKVLSAIGQDVSILETSGLVPVADLKIGDKFRHGKETVTIKEKEECPKDWRSHVHINRSNCFDERVHVRKV